jgi:glutathione S-transferase
MSSFKIILGNKNYSSWSLRPWLVLKHCGVPFEEEVIPLDQPTTSAAITRWSPAGRVPILLHGELAVWDSLAICEYLNEQFPERKLWTADPRARARARSISAEMHSGFQALRQQMPMKVKESIPTPNPSAEVKADIERILAIWTECRSFFGRGGSFLFGDFTIADAMFAPVVSRFHTYGVQMKGAAAEYAACIWNLPSMQEWAKAATAENFKMSRYETNQR